MDKCSETLPVSTRERSYEIHFKVLYIHSDFSFIYFLIKFLREIQNGRITLAEICRVLNAYI